MKLNYTVRMKNPWFWVGVVAVALTAIGVEPETFTSWQAVLEGLLSVLSNPVQLVTAFLSILSVFVDPTTSGISDSEQAMLYKIPKGDKSK